VTRSKITPKWPPMLHSTSPVLFESTDAHAVLSDSANEDWLALLRGVAGELFEDVASRYYAALSHFRRQQLRVPLPGRREVTASGKEQAFQAYLELMDERKRSEKAASSRDATAIFVEAQPDSQDESLPECLRDFSNPPPALSTLLAGPGRPPCDAMCLMRAFLGAPLVVGSGSPTDVFRLLRSNPTYARACGFLGRGAKKQPGELTSRKLPSQSTCEEFSEVMTRYGLWQCARIEQVRENLASGVVELEDTVAFDTTHVEANSHCGNVVPADAKTKSGKKPKHRKVPRLCKRCGCGKDEWESCEHSWVPTDQGAAVVVKGPTRIFWAHKTSVAAFGKSEIPIDVRCLQYAAEHDGKTLVPHLDLLARDFPEVIELLRHVLADDAYQGNDEAVAQFGNQAQLSVPIHPSRASKTKIAATYDGIDRFTPIGVPVCDAGHRFQMRGRDILGERYIWVAPDDDTGASVCQSCAKLLTCLKKGTRRHIRVDRFDFPQIDWEHPQHLVKNNKLYQRRTGVERAIKRLKVDLNAQKLTHRDGPRVQAHLDRALLSLHILIKSAGSG
jgi:hypothetical protein